MAAVKWFSTIALKSGVDEAVDVLSLPMAERLGEDPDLLVAFVAPTYRDRWPDLAGKLLARFPAAALVGCTAGGVIGAGREIERQAAISLTGAVLPGVDVTPFQVSPRAVPPADSGPAAWHQALGVAPARDPSFVVLTDPFTCDTERLLAGLDAAYPGSVKVGGLASGGRQPGQAALFLRDRVLGGGVAGVALSGDLVVETVVAQGCRPIGNPMFVTRAQRNVIYQLDGRPATAVLEELFAAISDEDRALVRQALFLGIVMSDGRSQYGPGDFLVRNVVGADPDAGAIAVGAVVEQNEVVQFHVRDARTSAADLTGLLSRVREGAGGVPPEGALQFSCVGRGAGLYGRPNHDVESLQEELGPVPVGGFFCNGEIGPVQGRTFLHGYTSSFALFRSRRRN